LEGAIIWNEEVITIENNSNFQEDGREEELNAFTRF
jgi:hypothetical protein